MKWGSIRVQHRKDNNERLPISRALEKRMSRLTTRQRWIDTLQADKQLPTVHERVTTQHTKHLTTKCAIVLGDQLISEYVYAHCHQYFIIRLTARRPRLPGPTRQTHFSGRRKRLTRTQERASREIKGASSKRKEGDKRVESEKEWDTFKNACTQLVEHLTGLCCR